MSISSKIWKNEKVKRAIFCRRCGVRKISGENHNKKCSNPKIKVIENIN